MDKRYRIFFYFLAILIVGSILVDWLSGSIRVPEPPRDVDAQTVPLHYVEPATTPTSGQAPSEAGSESKPSYSPSYENPSFAEEGDSSANREVRPSDQQIPTPIANSSDIQPAAPPPTAPAEEQGSPDRDRVTTSPKSSNAALREALRKGR
jgi:cytoskeletal protein RodZ